MNSRGLPPEGLSAHRFFLPAVEGEMRVTEMRTSRSRILRKNKPVLLGWTALRLCLNNLVSVVFSKKKKKTASKQLPPNVKDPLHM